MAKTSDDQRDAFLAAQRIRDAAPDLAEALQAWEHWYSVDSTEFNRDMAQFKGLAALKKAGL